MGWYAFTPENVSFRKMTMNGATKPVTVKLEEAVETELPAEGQERDSEFSKFVQKTLGRDLFPAFRSQDMDSARIGRKYPLEAFACSEERFIMEIIFLQKVHVQLERSALRIRS